MARTYKRGLGFFTLAALAVATFVGTSALLRNTVFGVPTPEPVTPQVPVLECGDIGYTGVTGNGEFLITLTDVTRNGPLVTFSYTVCGSTPQIKDLSHWAIDLEQLLDCYEGDLEDLFVDCSPGFGSEDNPKCGYITPSPDDQNNPQNCFYGVKWDTAGEAQCRDFTLTLDESKLPLGTCIDVGCVTAATKAGNQDCNDLGTYAEISGPVCGTCTEEICWKDETAWAAGTRYTSKGNWATYTPYSGVAKTVPLLAGQTIPAGTVSFSAPVGGKITICVTLNEGFRFDPNTNESVKIQPYATAPSGNPAPGLFAYKFDAETSPFCTGYVIPAANFYGVHVDVEQQVPCP